MFIYSLCLFVESLHILYTTTRHGRNLLGKAFFEGIGVYIIYYINISYMIFYCYYIYELMSTGIDAGGPVYNSQCIHTFNIYGRS